MRPRLFRIRQGFHREVRPGSGPARGRKRRETLASEACRFGNVGRPLHRLLVQKADELRWLYAISFNVTGVASQPRRRLANPEGLDLQALANSQPCGGETPDPVDMPAWLRVGQADAVFETTSLNVRTGQPALDHIRMALEHGSHAVSANKGPVVFASGWQRN